MRSIIVIGVFLVTSFLVFHFSRTGVSEASNEFPILERVVGGIESMDGVVHRCSINDLKRIPVDQLRQLLFDAAEETEDVLFHHIRTQVPSIEYKAYFRDSDSKKLTQVALLTDYENGYGKTGPASERLRQMIDEACTQD